MVDPAWLIRVQWDDVVYGRGAPDLYGHVPGVDTTIPLLREGNVTGQFWSVYVSCEHQVSEMMMMMMMNGGGDDDHSYAVTVQCRIEMQCG